MAFLGEFETAVKTADPDVEPDTFSLNGQEFTVAPDVNIIALGRFARAAREGADTDDMEGLASLIDTVASLVIEEDETRFLNTASKARVDADFLLRIVQAVLEAQSGHPTEQPSGSPDGLPTTGPSSKELSSSDESSVPKWLDTPFGRREVAANPELYQDFVTVQGVTLADLA